MQTPGGRVRQAFYERKDDPPLKASVQLTKNPNISIRPNPDTARDGASQNPSAAAASNFLSSMALNDICLHLPSQNNRAKGTNS